MVFDFVIDNVAVIVTIVYASYIIYRQEVSGAALPTNDLITAVLAVLGLLAVSQLLERYRKLGSIEKTNQHILSLLENQLAERPSALAFFEASSSLETLIRSSSTIDLCGLTMTTTLNKQASNLLERLEQGASVRLLIADPDSSALQMSTLRTFDPINKDYFRHKLTASLQDIELIEQRWTDIRKRNPKNGGAFTVRLLGFAPSFSVFAFNAAQSNGHTLVEIYAHRKAFVTPPVFELTAARDGDWYRYFTSQFEQMWEGAKEQGGS